MVGKPAGSHKKTTIKTEQGPCPDLRGFCTKPLTVATPHIVQGYRSGRGVYGQAMRQEKKTGPGWAPSPPPPRDWSTWQIFGPKVGKREHSRFANLFPSGKATTERKSKLRKPAPTAISGCCVYVPTGNLTCTNVNYMRRGEGGR